MPLAKIRVIAPDLDPLPEYPPWILQRRLLRDVVLSLRDDRYDVVSDEGDVIKIIESALYRFGVNFDFDFTVTDASTAQQRKLVKAGEKLIDRFSDRPSNQDFGAWWRTLEEELKNALLPGWTTYSSQILARLFRMCRRSLFPEQSPANANRERVNEIETSP